MRQELPVRSEWQRDVVATRTRTGHVFVLRGKREYQLLCRRKSSDSDDHCRLLLTSFRVT